jgi:hypothetical protein
LPAQPSVPARAPAAEAASGATAGSGRADTTRAEIGRAGSPAAAAPAAAAAAAAGPGRGTNSGGCAAAKIGGGEVAAVVGICVNKVAIGERGDSVRGWVGAFHPPTWRVGEIRTEGQGSGDTGAVAEGTRVVAEGTQGWLQRVHRDGCRGDTGGCRGERGEAIL